MDPNAYIVVQAGPDHPYTATTRPVEIPSTGANVRPKPSPLATREATSPSNDTFIRSSAPSPTTPAAVPAPSNAPNAGTNTPTLSTGSGSIPPSPLQSPARSPSPDAEALISSLSNYESLSDEALYAATLKAQQALVKWQNEYMVLETDISRMKGSPYSSQNQKAKPRKLANAEEYDRKHHAFLHQPAPAMVQTRGRYPRNAAIPRATNPITDNNPLPKGRGPRNELHIDMTAPMQPVEGKRIRKPRVLDHDDVAVSTPKKSTKRAREPDNDTNANTPAPDQAPPLKKQHTQQIRDIIPPAWVRTTTTIKAESEEPFAAPENEAEKRGGEKKGNTKTAMEENVEQETKEPAIGKEQATGKNPTRAAAAKLMWAKRKASGTNGRYGGKPTERTVAKAKKMMKGEEEGV